MCTNILQGFVPKILLTKTTQINILAHWVLNISNDDILQLPTDRERTDTSAREALDTKSD